MKTKKAISDIVSTVLIIMIAVAAVGIIGAVVVPMVRNSLQGGTACLNALSDVTVETEGTCVTYNNSAVDDTTNISLMIRKGTDASVDLESVVVQLIDSDGNSRPKTVTVDENLTLGGTWTYKIVNVTNDVKRITIAPVVKVGNSVKQCDASTSQIALVECKSN